MRQTCIGDFYRGRRVVVTGHRGLLGSWLVALLDHCGAEPVGRARGVSDGKAPVCTVTVDIRYLAQVEAAMSEVRPSIVLHLAAQSSTRAHDRRRTYEANILGSVNVLEAEAGCGVASIVAAGSSRDPFLSAPGLRVLERR